MAGRGPSPSATSDAPTAFSVIGSSFVRVVAPNRPGFTLSPSGSAGRRRRVPDAGSGTGTGSRGGPGGAPRLTGGARGGRGGPRRGRRALGADGARGVEARSAGRRMASSCRGSSRPVNRSGEREERSGFHAGRRPLPREWRARNEVLSLGAARRALGYGSPEAATGRPRERAARGHPHLDVDSDADQDGFMWTTPTIESDVEQLSCSGRWGVPTGA